MEKRIEEVWQGWKVIKKLGEGGFGAVYEIERDVFGKIEKAALKVISIPQSNDEIKEFYDEGYNEESITAHYRDYLEDIVKEYSLMLDMKGYTNIVYCDDLKYVKHQDGIGWDIFIKMELLTPMLKTVNAEYGESTVINLAKDICQALEVCRNANIVHRDIKPQNIFVSRSGDYKLGDFGIAKISEKTQSGTKIGTFEYMAPEVYSGKPYGAAADIYSLGLVLYWMLNERRHPFISASTHIPTANEKLDARMRRLGGEALPAPVNGSDELKRIVLKACAFNAEDRYQSSAEMLEDLLKLTPAKGAFASAVVGDKATKTAPKQEESDKTVAIFEAPTQPEISKKDEGSDKTEVLKKKEPKVAPKPQPKPEPKKENKVDYKEFAEPRKEEKKNKKGILFAIIGVVAVVVIIALILLLRSCGEETPVTDESSEAISEAVSEVVSETESSEAESSADVSDVSDESVENSEEISEDISEDVSVPEVHNHVYSESYKSNETAHWYECECGEVNGMKLHNYGEWTVLKEATETKEGAKERVCKDCNYKEEATIPTLGHEHSYITSWKENATTHWKECKCGEKSQLGTHNYGAWTTVTAATCTSNGTEKHTCQTCGYAETRNTSATGHSMGAWTTVTAATCTSNGTEKRTCTKCGHAETQTVTGGHKYEEGICIYCDDLQTKGLAYTLDGGTYTVLGIGNCKDTDIHIPSKYNGIAVTRISESAFENCNLTSVTIPDSVISIFSGAFYGNRLANVIIGNSVETIGMFAFYGNQLTNITIPDSVTTIGDSAFASNRLTSITIPDSVTGIGDYAFEDNQLTSVMIPNSVTELGQSAFENCTNLKSVTIGNSVTNIQSSTFSGCTALTSVTLPSSLREISIYAFENCTSLKSITIPDPVIYIAFRAFVGCSNLSSATFADTAGWYVEDKEGRLIANTLDVSNPSAAADYLTKTYVDNVYRKRT